MRRGARPRKQRAEFQTIKTMESHEYANIFPMLEDVQLQEMADSIKRLGLLNSIITLDGKILDGRNRYAACKMAGVEPHFAIFSGPDPLDFVWAQNGKARRHLTPSQLAMIGARVATLSRGQDPKNLNVSGDTLKTRKEAAEMVGVGEASVGRARAIINKGSPELVAAVDSGKLTVNAAVAVAKLPVEDQAAAIASETRDKPSDKIPRIKISHGDGIAIAVISNLEQIKDKDAQAIQAFEKVRDYCNARLSKLSK